MPVISTLERQIQKTQEYKAIPGSWKGLRANKREQKSVKSDGNRNKALSESCRMVSKVWIWLLLLILVTTKSHPSSQAVHTCWINEWTEAWTTRPATNSKWWGYQIFWDKSLNSRSPQQARLSHQSPGCQFKREVNNKGSSREYSRCPHCERACWGSDMRFQFE